LKARKGAGLRFLTETITSPTLAAQMKEILTDFPDAKWHQYEPVNRDNARAGAIMAFGQPVNTIYDFSKADRILSLGSDFLSAMPGTLRYARDYAARRRSFAQAGSFNLGVSSQMTRLYVVESTPTITGANADHRFSVKPDQMDGVARAFAGLLLPFEKINGVVSPLLGHEGPFNGDPEDFHEINIVLRKEIAELYARLAKYAPHSWAVSEDLENAAKSSVMRPSIIIVGDDQPPVIHALVHIMNDALGNVGKTVFYTDPSRPTQ